MNGWMHGRTDGWMEPQIDQWKYQADRRIFLLLRSSRSKLKLVPVVDLSGFTTTSITANTTTCFTTCRPAFSKSVSESIGGTNAEATPAIVRSFYTGRVHCQ